MTFIIARNTAAGSGLRVPTSLFDQAIAGLGSSLFAAMKANRANGPQPFDRISRELWARRASDRSPVVVPNDADFGHDSLDYTTGLGPSTIVPRGGRALPASLTVGILWRPTVDPATTAINTTSGALALLRNQGSGQFGLYLFGTAAGRLDLSPRFGSTALIQSTGLIRNGLNITLASIDAASRSVGLFQNSTSPLTASGGPDPYTTPNASQTLQIGGGGATDSDQSAAKIGAAFVVSEALHASPEGLLKARDVIEAASRTYGITLS